ncbi:hypothetical protein [Dokdonia sp.]|uniref:hypothetical protein n=1 Tax=Dokdonia sp. TaxID=2024995 RepID=UPI003265F254
MIYIIVPTIIFIGGTIVIYIKYSSVMAFMECNKIEFTSCVLSDLTLCEDTKANVQMLYVLNSPSFITLFLDMKPLSRKRYYSQDLQNKFFTPYKIRHPKLDSLKIPKCRDVQPG